MEVDFNQQRIFCIWTGQISTYKEGLVATEYLNLGYFSYNPLVTVHSIYKNRLHSTYPTSASNLYLNFQKTHDIVSQ